MYIDYKNCLDFRMSKCGRENAPKVLKKNKNYNLQSSGHNW